MVMKKRICNLIAIPLLAVLLVPGCATSDKAGRQSSSNSDSVISVEEDAVSLADYLSREPGVYIQGSGDNISVNIRGAQSVSGTNQPLFVINGQQVGRDYSVVNSIVDVNDIEYIEVLKGSEAGSRYGLRGSNGVIIIQTKSSDSAKGTSVEELLEKYGKDG